MSFYVDKKYINLVSARLERFSWKREDLANCRCPICGDSTKNKSKARGFFYKKSNNFFYRCHNCNFGSNLYNFLEQLDPTLMKQYSLERFKNGEMGKSNYKKPKETELMPIFSKPKFKKRDELLNESDWVVVKAQETNITIPSEWKTYRQALRDITKTFSSIRDKNFKFPDKPTD